MYKEGAKEMKKKSSLTHIMFTFYILLRFSGRENLLNPTIAVCTREKGEKMQSSRDAAKQGVYF